MTIDNIVSRYLQVSFVACGCTTLFVAMSREFTSGVECAAMARRLRCRVWFTVYRGEPVLVPTHITHSLISTLTRV